MKREVLFLRISPELKQRLRREAEAAEMPLNMLAVNILKKWLAYREQQKRERG